MANNTYDRNDDNSDSMARTLAIIALILSLIALGWAIKADRRAGDAMNKANSAISRQTP